MVPEAFLKEPSSSTRRATNKCVVSCINESCSPVGSTVRTCRENLPFGKTQIIPEKDTAAESARCNQAPSAARRVGVPCFLSPVQFNSMQYLQFVLGPTIELVQDSCYSHMPI